MLDSDTRTQADGDAEGTSAAVGASLGLGISNDHVAAQLQRDWTGGSVLLSALGANASRTGAKAAAKGAEKDDPSDDSDDDKVNDQAKSQRDFGGDKSEGGTGTKETPKAETSDNDEDGENDSVSVAAAIAINIADSDAVAVVEGITIVSSGTVTLRSGANTDASATADGSTTQGGTGIGAAVALNVADVTNTAGIVNMTGPGTTTVVTADGIVVEALMTDRDSTDVHSTSAKATSGASAGEIGVAGSLAINVTTVRTDALLYSGAQLTLQDGSDAGSAIGELKVAAVAVTKADAQALPKEGGATGADAAVGASLALNIANNDTRALVQTNAQITGAADVTVSASGKHEMTTKAKQAAASTGGVAVTPVVAISVALNDTRAEVQSGPAITTSGNVTIKATQVSDTRTEAEGKAEGTDAAVGASLGLTVAVDDVSALLGRDLTTTGSGAVLISAQGAAASRTSSKASSVGTEQADDSSSSDDKGVDKQAKQQRDFADKKTTDGTGDTGSKDSAENPKAETDEGAVSVAAAISVNIEDASSKASVADGVTINAAGAVAIKSGANTDGVSVADASAKTTDGGTSVGVAVGLSVTLTSNTATTGDTTITADGLTVEAGMFARDVKLEPKELPVVDIVNDTIFVDDVKNLTTGDKLVYADNVFEDGDPFDGDAIGGLTILSEYFVILKGDGRIQLAESKADATAGKAIDLTSTGSGDGHIFSRISYGDIESLLDLDVAALAKIALKIGGTPIITVNPASNHYELEIGNATGLATGDAVVYSKGDAANTAIGGLTDDTTYYAIIDGNGKLKLAASYADAIEGKKIKLTGKGTGEGHKISETVHSSGAFTKSGASGGDIGVAGSVAVNVGIGTTTALVADGAAVTLADGADAGAAVGDVAVHASTTSNNIAKALPNKNSVGKST
ncbi:MAG TPA: hypothetical protein VLI71_16585, partial [Gammaproteobacteria bacterium]|nr:hypothetical protein [Gammaproteobacteria bacterium]